MRDRAYCADLSKVVFITNSLGGHRLTWFLNLHSLQKDLQHPVELIFFGESQPSFQLHAHLFKVHKATSKSDAIHIAEALYNANESLVFIFLDGEQWMRYVIGTHIPSRILIMRPFVSSLRAAAFLQFLLKRIVVSVLGLKKNLEVSYLKIPHYTPFLGKHRWVNDNLTTIDILGIDLAVQKKRQVFTILVPGFIDERKSPNLILEIMENLENQYPNHFQVFFIGSVTLEVKNLIQSSNLSNVIYQDVYLSRPEYLEEIREADLILLLYKNRSASGILMEALSMNKRIVMHKSYLWSNLARIAPHNLTFISRKHVRAVKQFQELISVSQVISSISNSADYEFLDENDPLGLIRFIFS